MRTEKEEESDPKRLKLFPISPILAFLVKVRVLEGRTEKKSQKRHGSMRSRKIIMKVKKARMGYGS